MAQSENSLIIRSSLASAFAESVRVKDMIQNETPGVLFKYNFNTIQARLHRFWTDDFLQDLIRPDSGIGVPLSFLIDFSARYHHRVLAEAVEKAPDSAYFTNHRGRMVSTICEMIFEERDWFQSFSDEDPDEGEKKSLQLFHGDVADFHRPIARCVSEDDVRQFVRCNSFLIPFYMLFATGAYGDVVTMIEESLRIS